jgi:NADPH:quinone reductase-like Zn-dependent oxidoreductase
VDRDVRPVIHATHPLQDARRGFESMLEGDIFGKVVFTL